MSQFLNLFLLKDNCFTEFCCFLSNLNMNIHHNFIIRTLSLEFPGGPVVRNLPVNAGYWVQSLVQTDPTCEGQLSPCATNTEPGLCCCCCCCCQSCPTLCDPRDPCLLRSLGSGACIPQQKKPPQWEVLSPQVEKACIQDGRPSAVKTNNKNTVIKTCGENVGTDLIQTSKFSKKYVLGCLWKKSDPPSISRGFSVHLALKNRGNTKRTKQTLSVIFKLPCCPRDNSAREEAKEYQMYYLNKSNYIKKVLWSPNHRCRKLRPQITSLNHNIDLM